MILPTLKWNIFIFRQCMLATAVTMDVILLGGGYVFSATLLPQLEQDSSIKITKNEGTWIASLSSLGCIPGSLGGCFLLQLFGRKWSYVIIALSNVIAWSVLASSTHVWHFFIGRALQGLTAGLGYTVIICYIVEVFDLKYRSVILNLINVGAAVGMLIVDAIGSYYHYSISAYVLASLAGVYFCIFLYLKNTHVWYLQRGEVQQARDHYFWYKKETSTNEENFKMEQELAEVTVTYRELLKEWQRREFYIPMLIILWFNTTIMFTGGFGIMLYSVEIMNGVVSIDEYLTTIIIDVLRVLSTFGTSLLLTYTTSRFIINMSSVFCTISLLVISLSLFLKERGNGSNTLALVAILVFNFFFNLGYVNFGNICLGELLTGVGKSSGTAFSGMYFFLLYFSFGHLVPAMFQYLGNVLCFLVFSVCTFVGGTVLYLIMPETKGVSNKQIRENFKTRNKHI